MHPIFSFSSSMIDDDHSHQTTTTATSTTASTTRAVALIVIVIVFISDRAKADDNSIMYNLAKSVIPTPPGWLGRDPCKWPGVKCDSSKRVISISLDSKGLSGILPPDLPQLSQLQTLSLEFNSFSGTVPALANMSSLQDVCLDSNAFTNIPNPFLVGLPNLQIFSIENNPLDTWTIPLSLTDSSGIQEFRAGNASLGGSIPDIFKSLPSLQTLRLPYNNLTSFLPASLDGSSINILAVNNQKQGLSGTLGVLAGMASLTQVWVHVNEFVGPIPDLSICTSLFDLQLRDNQLTGPVPPSVYSLPGLLNISLGNNHLQGPVPVFKTGIQTSLRSSNGFCNPSPGPCDPQVTALIDIAGGFGYPLELADSWAGNDACKDWAHVTCDTNGKVVVVNLAKNNWSGVISPSFANLTALNSIMLNDNNLVGLIPNDLTSLKGLKRLDVSNNNLTGKVPSFAANVVIKMDGNEFIGSNVDTVSSLKAPPGEINNNSTGSTSGSRSGTSAGSDTGGSSSSSESWKSTKSRLSTSKIVGIVLGTILGAMVIGLIMFLLIKKKREKKNLGGPAKDNSKNLNMMSAIENPPIKSTMDPNQFSTSSSNNVFPIEILREVTNNFNEKCIVGRGGFGVVYKGILHDETQIAVKRMEFSNLKIDKGKNEFEAEIEVLSKVRHRHLVALLGYCAHENERFVVYEYMPQGTLSQHLFEQHRRGSPSLTWKQRLVIALDVARGVEYLHSLAQQSFIHRDLKPSNVLLGDDMRAKVSDFGLVKSAPDQGKYSVETRIAGTFGYLAPEYANTGRVTTKVDIFAFGVVLMELITGRKALDENLPEEQAQLVTWFRRVLISKDHDLRKIIDYNLESETHDEEIFESITKVAELSGHCTTRDPQQRPDMSHAVNILSPLVVQWKPADQSDGDEDGDNDRLMSLPQALQRWQAGDTLTSMSGYSSWAPTTPSVGHSFTNLHEGR